MSAWYIFSSMGFYPFSSATKEYRLGIAMYEYITINTSYDSQIINKTQNNHEHFYFVNEVKINNDKINRNYLCHDDLISGANIEFKVGLLPVDKSQYKKPYSITSDE